MKKTYIAFAILFCGIYLGNAQAEVNCEEAWKQYVESNPVGRFNVYNDKTKMSTGFSSNIHRTTTVAEAGESVVKFNQELKQESGTQTSNYQVDKASFIKGCKSNTQNGKLLEKGEKTITVPAGTFDCRYEKREYTGQGMSTISTLYYSTVFENPNYLIRMETQTKTPQFTATSTSELVEYGE